MRVQAFKYLSPLLIYISALQSFSLHGIYCYFPLIYSWVIIPGLELFIPPQRTNLSEAEELLFREDRFYDWILYFFVLLLFPTLWLFLSSMQEAGLSLVDRMGRIGSMGMICGTFGINVGHELGHRQRKYERFLARLSLMISLYMHFYIEHNRGHHKRVATPQDPSSARFNETVYAFWFRSGIFSYLSAWHIAATEMRKKNLPVISLRNEMNQVHSLQGVFLVLIYLLFGWPILGYYLVAAFMGMLLLETVNYIEHYGLERKQSSNGNFERAMPQHSWNSDHILGRMMLFELSRHSDHHYLASRKYQILRHHNQAPQMPTGYPGMMMLSLLPPLWFKIMNPRVRENVGDSS